MLRSATPALIAQEHAAWVISAELARAIARDAAAVAAPARKGRRAGLPVHPREISFTAARRAIIASTRSGAATASLPPALISREPGPHPGQPGPVPDHRRTGTGTATARPRPGSASRTAARASPRSPHPPRSASAAPQPDPAPVTILPSHAHAGRGTGRHPGAPSGTSP